MEGIQMSTDCFDGTKGLGRSSTSFKDDIFGCFRWTSCAVGRLGSHFSIGLPKRLVKEEGIWLSGEIEEQFKSKFISEVLYEKHKLDVMMMFTENRARKMRYSVVVLRMPGLSGSLCTSFHNIPF